jgi:hypothetical protein
LFQQKTTNQKKNNIKFKKASFYNLRFFQNLSFKKYFFLLSQQSAIEKITVETSYPPSSNKTRPGSEKKISDTIEFPKNLVIVGNFAVALWIILDLIGFLLFNILVGAVFLLVIVIGIYGILKFLGCLRPCYNCKKCTFGMGRITVLYFGKRSLKDYTKTYGLPVAIFFYILLGHFPTAVSLFSAIQSFTIFKVVVFAALFLISIYSALTWRKTDKP